MHPFDDAVDPVNGCGEGPSGPRSRSGCRCADVSPESVASLARDVLNGYRERAITAGEPYYARRYDTTSDQGT